MSRLYFRNPRLCTAILGYLYDTDTDEALPWDELVERFTTERRSWKTVENRLYDLIAFGAIHRIGGNRIHRQRGVKLTPLGRAWYDNHTLAHPIRLGVDLTNVDDHEDYDEDD